MQLTAKQRRQRELEIIAGARANSVRPWMLSFCVEVLAIDGITLEWHEPALRHWRFLPRRLIKRGKPDLLCFFLAPFEATIIGENLRVTAADRDGSIVKQYSFDMTDIQPGEVLRARILFEDKPR